MGFATAALVLNATQVVDFVLAVSRAWAGGLRTGLGGLLFVALALRLLREKPVGE